MIHFERLKSEKQSSRLKNANGFLLESFLIKVSYRRVIANAINSMLDIGENYKCNINLAWLTLTERSEQRLINDQIPMQST